MTESVARLENVSLHYGKTQALDDVTLSLPAGQMVGLIGPDGVGKSSLLSLVAGARQIQTGTVIVLGGDMGSPRHRDAVCPRIAYMPQGLGKNLYPSLTVEENLQFFGRLFGHDLSQRRHRIDVLTRSTGLYPFLMRPVGKLSGGMKQKLGLCCALIHDPDLLILDEPTTGVDPLARSQFWDLISTIRGDRPGMSVLVATAYMEEAERFDWLVALDGGRVLATDTPSGLKARTRAATLEAAFIALLPESRRREHKRVELRPFLAEQDGPLAIEARDLTMRFGDFVAVDHVSFQIRRGEIFGFLGSNGCGKSTTMKMLTGLLPPTQGEAWLFGKTIDSRNMQVRQRVGYMSQSFSLYAELSVEQNLVLHARLFCVPETEISARVQAIAARFGLVDVLDSLPGVLPLGIRQRLSLAVAVVHGPALLILDEPTSGVDPIARDMFWQHMIDLARNDGVTLFISTHFMNEAERCDRISFMHAGRVLVSDSPKALVEQCGADNLEGAFIHYLQQAVDEAHAGQVADSADGPATERVSSLALCPPQVMLPLQKPGQVSPPSPEALAGPVNGRFSLSRLLTCAHLESLQLKRDPVRRLLALLGTLMLMLIMAYGISMDVEDLTYAVLDHDQTTLSRGYDLNMAGSPYFVERSSILDHADLDRRMRSGEIALAIEIPPGFARDLKRGEPAEIGAWIDGANPQRAETIRGYLLGMHQGWLVEQMRLEQGVDAASMSAFALETRYRYNPDVKSLPAMVPAVIPLLLLMIPAMLTALAVVREKELGSILNFYVTPVRRSEFLLGKQLPYVVLGMFNFLLMAALAVTLFGVPVTGSFATLLLASFIYVVFATGFGLFASSFTRSQIAALFLTMIGTILPAIQFAGLLNPVSSLEGPGALIGQVYPATYYLLISRGVFSKALGLAEVWHALWPLALSVPFILALSVALLRKQER